MKVRVVRRFRASPERVFDAWLDPETARRWLFATASRPTRGVEIDARKGGSFRFADRRGAEYSGRYLEIDRPWRLVFALSTENDPRIATRVIAEIVPLKSGCELTLRHEGVAADAARAIEGRWTGMLYGLSTIIDVQRGPDDGGSRSRRPVPRGSTHDPRLTRSGSRRLSPA